LKYNVKSNKIINIINRDANERKIIINNNKALTCVKKGWTKIIINILRVWMNLFLF